MGQHLPPQCPHPPPPLLGLLVQRCVHSVLDAVEVMRIDQIRLTRDGDRVSGPRMKMKLDESTGVFEQPNYSIRRIKTGSAPTLWTGNEERESRELTTGSGAASLMADHAFVELGKVTR